MKKLLAIFIALGFIPVAQVAVHNEDISGFTQMSSEIRDVPFTAQAPFAEWDDPRQQEGCEEASVLMAMHWVHGTSLSKEQARESILAMSHWQQEQFGYFHDTSAHDTANRLIRGYFDYHRIEERYHIDTDDIKKELAKGYLVLVPVNGRSIQNRYFTPPGPHRHMIVVHGYDEESKEFIAHDPGTRRGANYRYSEEVLQASLRDYPSGTYAPLEPMPTAMIIFKR